MEKEGTKATNITSETEKFSTQQTLFLALVNVHLCWSQNNLKQDKLKRSASLKVMTIEINGDL